MIIEKIVTNEARNTVFPGVTFPALLLDEVDCVGGEFFAEVGSWVGGEVVDGIGSAGKDIITEYEVVPPNG